MNTIPGHFLRNVFCEERCLLKIIISLESNPTPLLHFEAVVTPPLAHPPTHRHAIIQSAERVGAGRSAEVREGVGRGGSEGIF